MQILKSRETKILSVGGYYARTSVKTVFSLNNEPIVVYPDLPIPLDYHCTLKVDNFVYCIGGRVTNESNRVFNLNLNETEMEWNKMAEMNNKRFIHGAAVFNDTFGSLWWLRW